MFRISYVTENSVKTVLGDFDSQNWQAVINPGEKVLAILISSKRSDTVFYVITFNPNPQLATL